MDSFNIPIDSKIQSEMDSVSLRRGNILANFSFIESLISEFIIRHYLKDEEIVIKMREDIFEDEYFSYILKFNLFKKSLQKYYPSESDKFPIEKFRQLGKLRNIIAHASVTLSIDKNKKKVLTNIMFLHNGEKVDAQEKMDEYDKLKKEIQPQLQDLAGNLNLFNINIHNDFTK